MAGFAYCVQARGPGATAWARPGEGFCVHGLSLYSGVYIQGPGTCEPGMPSGTNDKGNNR